MERLSELGTADGGPDGGSTDDVADSALGGQGAKGDRSGMTSSRDPPKHQGNSKRTGPFADERGRRSIRYPGAVISACSSLRYKYEIRADSPSIDSIARQEAGRPSDVVAMRRAAMV